MAPPGGPTDDLVRDAVAGRVEARMDAVDALYARVAPRLLAYVRMRMGRTLRARMDSGDILQATLLKSFERFDEFQGAGKPALMAWLARIAEREILDRADYHQAARRSPLREAPLTGPDLPDARVTSVLSRLIRDERAGTLERAMDGLTDAHREIILLRKFQELSFREIAARLGKSEDACRMLLARALTALTLRCRQMTA
jgi:RNA polymerase sigma-70 factor (ECF subfamily)